MMYVLRVAFVVGMALLWACGGDKDGGSPVPKISQQAQEDAEQACLVFKERACSCARTQPQAESLCDEARMKYDVLTLAVRAGQSNEARLNVRMAKELDVTTSECIEAINRVVAVCPLPE